jgi:putative transposase
MLQQVLRRLEKAFIGMWESGRGFPRFKKQGRMRSLLFPQLVCWKRGVYFAKVNPDGTSQTCPNCNHHTGKKDLSERIHHCGECGYTTDRDVAAAQIVMQRGLAAVGYTVKMLGDSVSEAKAWGLSASSLLTQNPTVLALRNRGIVNLLSHLGGS